LLPALNADTHSQNEEATNTQSTDSLLSDFLQITNPAQTAETFKISDFESQIYQTTLDDLAERWDGSEELTQTELINIDTTVGSSVGLSSGFTVGYMIWLLRGGTLMGSMLSSLPAWRLVDPLPILVEMGGELDDDNESLESMVGNNNDGSDFSKNQTTHP